MTNFTALNVIADIQTKSPNITVDNEIGPCLARSKCQPTPIYLSVNFLSTGESKKAFGNEFEPLALIRTSGKIEFPEIPRVR